MNSKFCRPFTGNSSTLLTPVSVPSTAAHFPRIRAIPPHARIHRARRDGLLACKQTLNREMLSLRLALPLHARICESYAGNVVILFHLVFNKSPGEIHFLADMKVFSFSFFFFTAVRYFLKIQISCL